MIKYLRMVYQFLFLVLGKVLKNYMIVVNFGKLFIYEKIGLNYFQLNWGICKVG